MRVIGLNRRFRSPPVHPEVLYNKAVREALFKAHEEHRDGAIDSCTIPVNLKNGRALKKTKWASIKARTSVHLKGSEAEVLAAFKRLTEYQVQSFVFFHEEDGPFIR